MLTLARKPPPLGEEINDPRIKRLHSIFNTDPVGARTLAWHATQIIALSRWRPVFSPVEGMRLFLAGVVLWGFGNYHRVVTHDASTALYHRQDDYVRLDLLPWASGGSGAARGTAGPEDWMRYGKGTATIEICGEVEGVRVVEVCGEEGAKEVLRVVVGILSGLKVWGLGGEFKEVLEGLMAR